LNLAPALSGERFAGNGPRLTPTCPGPQIVAVFTTCIGKRHGVLPSQAAALFALVERNGPRNTRIEISN
jgi:hypothetical protein